MRAAKASAGGGCGGALWLPSGCPLSQSVLGTTVPSGFLCGWGCVWGALGQEQGCGTRPQEP